MGPWTRGMLDEGRRKGAATERESKHGYQSVLRKIHEPEIEICEETFPLLVWVASGSPLAPRAMHSMRSSARAAR